MGDASSSSSAVRYVAHGSGHFLAEKAGMAGVDKAHVARVVEEASKGSKYYENAQKRDAQLCARIAAIRDELARTPASQIRSLEQGMKTFAARQRAGADLARVWVVVDMDAYFCAVEERTNPALRGKAFAVGGMGMISTASYEARKYGVRSAMPGFIAVKLCPHLQFVRHHFDRYTAAAEEARGVFRRYDPHMSSHSLDEAVLDITDYCVAAGIIPPPRGDIDKDATGKDIDKDIDKDKDKGASAAAAGAASVTAAADAAASSSSSSSPSSSACDSSSASTSGSSNSAHLFPPGLPWDSSAPVPVEDAAADDDDDGEGECSSAAVATLGSSSRSADGVLSLAQHHAIAAVVARMRHEVTVATRGLTCSAGIACNPMLAKIVSNDRKPNGQCMVPFGPAAIAAYMRGLSVRKLPGVGKVTEKTLTDLGFSTCGDVLDQMGRLRAAFNERTAHWLVRSSLGISDGERHGFAGMEASGTASGESDDGVGRKSISQERTFADCRDFNVLAAKACELSRQIAAQMTEEGIIGRTVTVKMKLHTFEVRQRSITLPKPTADGKTIETNAVALLRAEMPCTLRLLGVRVSALAAKAAKPTALDAFVSKVAAATSSSSAVTSSRGSEGHQAVTGSAAGAAAGAVDCDQVHASVGGRKRSRPTRAGEAASSGDHDDDRDSLATVPDEGHRAGLDDTAVIEISSDEDGGENGDDDGIGSLGSAPSDDDDIDLQLDDIIDISRLSQASGDAAAATVARHGDDGGSDGGGRAVASSPSDRAPPAKRRALERSLEDGFSAAGLPAPANTATSSAAGAAAASAGGRTARALPTAAVRRADDDDDDVVLIADVGDDDADGVSAAAPRIHRSHRSSSKRDGATHAGQLPWAKAAAAPKPQTALAPLSRCPVCNMTLSRSVQDINNHLDACLKSKQRMTPAAAR